MTPAPTNPAPAASPLGPGRPPPRLARVGGAIIRVLTVACLAAGGWFLILTYRAMFSAPPVVTTPPADARTAGPLAPPADALSLAGTWLVGDGDWVVRWRSAPGGRLPDPPPDLPPADRGLPGDLEAALLEWAQAVGERYPGGYAVALGAAHGRIATRGDGPGERVQFAQAAWPVAEGRWVAVEVAPRAGGVVGPPGPPHLVPLPAGALSVARRWGPDGRPAAELVRCPGGVQALRDGLAAAGWTAVPAADGGVMARAGDRLVRGISLGDAPPTGEWVLLIPTSPAGELP